jgi:hypothetical protein
MLEMSDRKEQHMIRQTDLSHPSPTARALAAAHDAPVATALDGVRWVRIGLLQRLKRDTVN